MISFRASALPVLGFLIVLAGCAGQTSTASGPDSTEGNTQAANVVAASPAQAGRFHGGPGQEFLLRAALREQSLNLTDAQKTTIQNAMTASQPQSKGPPPDMKAHMATLAASVRSGKFDTAQSFQPNQDDVNAHIAASAKALDTLHATLTPTQRQALVDAVSKKGGEHHGREMGERGGDHMKEGRGPMGGLLIGLNVTDAQQAEIDAKLDAQKPSDADRAQMKAQREAFETQMKARLATFASDNFDATAFVTPPAGALNQGHKDRMAEDLAIITSVLDASQRDKLATRLEQGPKAQAPANVEPAQPIQK